MTNIFYFHSVLKIANDGPNFKGGGSTVFQKKARQKASEHLSTVCLECANAKITNAILLSYSPMRLKRNTVIGTLSFIISLCFFSLIFFLNRTFMGNFDESDHLVAGHLMQSGRLMYSQNFSHHFPFPYYWTYLFSFFWSADNPSRTIAVFRLSLLALYVFAYALVFILFRNNKSRITMSIWILTTSLFFIVYQGYVVTTEVIDAIMISAITWLILPIVFGWEKPRQLTFSLLVLFAGIAFWTQPLMILLFITPFILVRDKKTFLRVFTLCTIVLILPLALFALNGQLSDFLFQGLYFNLFIYPVHYFDALGSGGDSLWNSLVHFLHNEYLLFTQVQGFLQITQFIFHLTTVWLLWVILKMKNWRTLLLVLILLIASRAREIKATVGVPFNAGMYPFILFASACFTFFIFSLYYRRGATSKLLAIVLFVFICISNGVTFKPIFLQSLRPGYNYHVFWSYRQDKGALIRMLSQPQERVLIYPHDVELYYFADRIPPDRFTYWFPWIHAVSRYRQERLNALKETPPPVLYIGDLGFKGMPGYYARFFPTLTLNYVPVIVKGEKTGVWLRKNLKERLSRLPK